MKLSTAVFAAAGFVLVTACACGANTTAHHNGYLQSYHRLGHVGGVPLEQVWIEPEFDVRKYRTLYIAPVQIDPYAYRRNGEEDRQKAHRLADAYRMVLEQELQGSGIFQFVSTDPYFSRRREGALVLETRITEVNSGNPRQRVMIGFGAGATEVQVEGKVIELKTCRTLVEYADRRLHGGGAMFWGRKNAEDSELLMGVDMKGILRGVVKLFIFLREEGPPVDQR
jgi:Domain of unknown function (DUF4410)/Protein of unknown function (DUF3313)